LKAFESLTAISYLPIVLASAAQIPGAWSPGRLYFFYGVSCYFHNNYCMSFNIKIRVGSHRRSRNRKMSLQRFGSLVWTLLRVTFLSPRIWRWLIGSWKVGGSLVLTFLAAVHLSRYRRTFLSYLWLVFISPLVGGKE
jgi:hypothetical protein